MERIYPGFSFGYWLSFLIVFLLQKSTQAQLCSAPVLVQITENNAIGQVVTTITITEGVTLSLTTNPGDLFEISGPDLRAKAVLDFETVNLHTVIVSCSKVTEPPATLTIYVNVIDVNDNPPVFDQSQYNLNVKELLPKDTVVGTYTATDKDSGTQIYYRLIPESEGFAMQSITSPNIIVNKMLDYDTIKHATLMLYAQDTAFSSAVVPSYTATATIQVTMVDVDNRPPWFQPCTLYTDGGGKICFATGYTGSVNATHQEVGPLPLEPGPVYAIDGDSGINEEMEYTIISGNVGDVFLMDAISGNITMTKAPVVAGPIQLTVMASQKVNIFQFAITSVTLSVRTVTDNPPRFEKEQYSGFVMGVGTMALDPNDDNLPLKIQAKDADHVGGVNPAIGYEIVGSADFSLIDGFLFMMKELSFGVVTFQVKAVDSTTGESTTAGLTIEVTSGIPTTSVSPGTTEITPGTTEITTNGTTDVSTPGTTEITPGTTNVSTPGTTQLTPGTTEVTPGTTQLTPGTTELPTPGTTEVTPGTTELTPGTTEVTPGTPELPTPGPTGQTPGTSLPTANTAHPPTEGVINPSGVFGPEDMAALGASLAVLLFICLVVIGVLVCQLKEGKTAWKKITEASLFRSSLGQGSRGMKEGVQYTNEAFQKDEDGDSDAGSPAGREEVTGGKAGGGTPGNKDTPLEEIILKSTAPLHALLDHDDASMTDSDKADGENKEVKPILTKERRHEEGYKSVWFKEDIDPNAKDEVVIIPDSREHHGEEDDDEEEEEEESFSGREDDDDDDEDSLSTTMSIPKATLADMDSGIEVKIQDQGDDSGDDNDFL